MAEAVVSFVLQNMTDFFNSHSHLLHDQLITDHIQRVFDKFRWMQPFLKNADARLNEDGVRIWAADLRNLVYDAEDVIESFLLKASSATNRGTIPRYFGVLNERLHHLKFVGEMKAIHKRMEEISTRLHHYNITTMAADYSSYEMPGKLQRFYSPVIVEPVVVGLQDDVDQLVARLTDESDDSHRVVSICGMGGLGKTTLAKKIYNHSAIKQYFDCLAWVSVSQNLQLTTVLQKIILCLIKDEKKREEIMKLDDSKLMEKLHEIQSTTKCLVVVDDIWRNEDWDRLKPAFPTQRSSKSKLMLTSRNVQLSHHVDPNAFLHRPRLLDDEQSWDLLRMRAAPRMDPRDVEKKEKFGKEMVGHCGGLPLAIVVLGGILVTKETWMEWEMVHKDMQSSIRGDKSVGKELQRAVEMILVKSYNDLPHQLKPCFLYLGRFGEDVEIEAVTLYQLWIAEGFVLSSDRRVEGETLMEVAESYLAELVHKCMVQVKFEEKESSLRKFRSFVLHDSLRDLALLKAKEEECFNVLDLRQDNAAKLNGDMHLAETTRTRRLDIYIDSDDVISSKDIRLVKKSGRYIRSVLWFNEGEWSMKHSPPIVRLKLANFRFLRVLSLEGFDFCDKFSFKDIGPTLRSIWYYAMKNMFSEVLRNLIHLRYLSFRNTEILRFPSSIENLVQLQTLDLRVRSGDLWSLPWEGNDKMRKMGELQHLYLPKFGVEKVGSSSNYKLRLEGLSKLETLENFDSKWCQVQDLHKLNNLRKLKMETRGGDDLEETMQYLESKVSSCFRYISLRIGFGDEAYTGGNGPSPWKRLFEIDGLKLNKLKISGDMGELPAPDVCNLVGANCLTHLDIFWSSSKGDLMPLLEKLPALRYLRLFKAFEVKKMVCSNMGFLQLKRLELSVLDNLENWEVEQGSMPNLEELLIFRCHKLEQLPEGLKFINSLQKLTIVDMTREFGERVRGPHFYKVAHVPFLDNRS